MDCLVLLLLLCGCGGCGNGVSGNSNGNCCEKHHCHHHHHHNHCNRERGERVREADVCEETCDCMENDVFDAVNMAPPSWRDFSGVTRDCDCNN